MRAVPQMDIKPGVTSAGVSWWTLTIHFAVSFAKSRGAIPSILAEFQIRALTYRGTASAALPHPQSMMLLTVTCAFGQISNSSANLERDGKLPSITQGLETVSGETTLCIAEIGSDSYLNGVKSIPKCSVPRLAIEPGISSARINCWTLRIQRVFCQELSQASLTNYKFLPKSPFEHQAWPAGL